MIRRLVPYSLLPLALIACALASAPWLRAYPSGVIAVPLFAAAVLSVVVPVIAFGVGVRRLAFTALIDVVVFVFYELLVTLREPAGFADLYHGLVHGPSQILTFALPLVSPRTLLVAPVALCWLAGAIVGECLARGWQSVLPYLTLLATFGLCYAATTRAVSSSADGRRYDTLLAGALLLALLLLRAAQAWVGWATPDGGAEIGAPEGAVPLRGLGIGAVLATVVAIVAAGVVQGSAFSGPPVTPARTPPLDQSRPLTPVSFVSGLRPKDVKSIGRSLFTITTSRPTTHYIALASVDYYDGDGWSFTRTFRPSGGVVPADPDPSLRPSAPPVDQHYTIAAGPMTTAPWMPYIGRAQRVSGTSVDIDSDSGMIVPSHPLHAGEQYTVRSVATTTTFDELGRNALPGTSAPQVDTSLPNGLYAALGTLIGSLAQETAVSSATPIAFLQAVARDFRTNSALAGAPPAPTSTTRQPSPTAHRAPSSAGATRAPTPTPTPTAGPHTGGTTFADVLASIRVSRSATPEQYATLAALVARRLGVPARVVSGFRITPPHGSAILPAGTYDVRSGQAWTWVEIPVRGLGWVVLDPSPSTYAGQPPQQSGAPAATQSPSATPSQNALLTHSNNGGHAVAPPSTTPHHGGLSAASILVVVLIVLFVLGAAWVVLLLVRKRVRARRRRRIADPRRRLLGAWQEGLDVLAEAGLSDLAHLSSTEVAAAAGTRFGDESATHARVLGDAADRAIFSVTTQVAVVDADAAWHTQRVLTRSVRSRLGWRARLRAGLRYNRRRRLVGRRHS